MTLLLVVPNMPCQDIFRERRSRVAMIGQLVGHYRIVEKIGAGAMGEVFRARDERLGRDVALKMILPASSDNPDRLHRFEQEARAAAALNHPNILAIYDVGFEGKTPYIVSELLEGKTLRQCLWGGPISMRDATDYALQIAHGLNAAHERHMVHRDLKPENLFLTNDGRIKILDFGVAKLLAPLGDDRTIQDLTTVTKAGAVVGTVAYMAPEQLRSKAVDHRSDIFSFGAILYEMLTGSRAFRGETEVDTITAVLREEPPDAELDQASVPSGYQDIIRHCLDKDPENRFQSVKDLAFALQTISGTSTTRPALSRTPARQNPGVLPWILAGAFAVAAAVFATFLLRSSTSEPVYRRVTFESGTIYSARFASDGQSIVYSSAWNNGPVQLFSTVGNSTLSQPLNLHGANLLALSQGNELAVVLGGMHTGQLETARGMLAVTPLAGGSPRQVLADVRWADWNPAGKLAVVHNVEGHSRLEYPIGTVLYQSGGWISHIRFSPQGDRIAFIDHPALWDTRGDVRVVDLSAHSQVLSPNWEAAEGVAWRKDGKEVWFTAASKGSNLSLMAVTLSGKARTVLTLPVGLVLQDLSSDGRALVTLTTRRLAMSAGNIGTPGEIDLSWHDWSIAKDISRDGQFLLFEDASEAAGPDYAVVVRKFDDSLPIRLGSGSAGGLSPDGQWAVSVSTGNPPQVNLLPLGAGQPHPVEITGLESVQNGWAHFLPDGKRISINGNEAGHGLRCYLLDLSGAKPKPVTPEGISCGTTSPDSRFIAGVGSNSVALYPLQNGAPRPIPSDFQPLQFTPDGGFLYGYRRGEFPTRIYKLEISTGKQAVSQELRPQAPAGVVSIAPVTVSPDGKRFAYSYNQSLSVLFLVSELH